MKDLILVIVGPTAVGKSALAMRLADSLNGEIISADSRQVYRYMEIGTAKPTPEDRSKVPHHLIDLVYPNEDYSLVIFLQQASKAIQNVKNRVRLPIIAGGTGQYVWGMLEGWQIPEVRPNPELRRRLEARVETEGAGVLYSELSRIDPAAAQRIDPRNVRRIVRALEVGYSSSPGTASSPRKSSPSYSAKVIGLTLERSELYRRIDERVDAMIAQGLVEEVRGLLEMGYSPELPSMSSVGYQELMRYLAGEFSIDEAAQRIKYRTHRIARHQYAWFRLNDERITWFDVSRGLDAAVSEAERWALSL